MATDLLTFGIPFFFMLAVVFGALEIAGVFQNKGVKLIIAIVVAFFAASDAAAAAFIFSVLPYATMFFVIVFFVGFLAKARQGEKKDWLLIAMILVLLLLAVTNLDIFNDAFGNQTETILYIVGIVIIIMILYAAYQKSADSGPTR